MANDKISDDKPRISKARFALLLSISLLAVFLYMVSDLLLGVIVGILLWAITKNRFERVLKFVKGRRPLAAFITTLLTLIFVVVPAVLILFLTTLDAANVADTGQKWYNKNRPRFDARVNEITQTGSIQVFGYSFQITTVIEKIQQQSGTVANFVFKTLTNIAVTLGTAILLVFVVLYTLFFFYLDGDAFFEWLKKMLPLSHEQSDRLVKDFFATSIATLKTLGVIGLVQGGLGGIAFWVCGIPGPFFWTVLMAIATVIPSVGAQIILLPASIILIWTGNTWAGIGLFLWSWIVIANIDNVLRPYLVKRAINLHELVVFLSTIGGIAMFGFFGFLIGPVIASLLKASLQIYSEIYQLESPANSI